MNLDNLISNLPHKLNPRSEDKISIGPINPYIQNNDIEIPENFNTVILKICSEIMKIEIIGYKYEELYERINFEKITKFLVGVKIYFKEKNVPMGNMGWYETLLNDYFKMTYGGEMDFISFKVEEFVSHPVKSSREKFFELFKKN
jgi:hypothetical protein